MILGIEYTEYREVYVSVKEGHHPILSNTFKELIRELRIKQDRKQNSSSSSSSISGSDDLYNNMIMCKVEMKGKMMQNN
jgi:hypothetical protein